MWRHLLLLSTHTGTVRYAYHKFGPLSDTSSSSSNNDNTNIINESASKVIKRKDAMNPVVFIAGWGTSMYIWPIPVSTQGSRGLVVAARCCCVAGVGERHPAPCREGVRRQSTVWSRMDSEESQSPQYAQVATAVHHVCAHAHPQILSIHLHTHYPMLRCC